MNSSKPTITTANGLEYRVTAAITEGDLLERVGDTEMLVVTKLRRAGFNGYAQVIDQALGGALSRAADGWCGELGTYRLLSLPALGLKIGRLQDVMLAGLGNPRDFGGQRLCAFTAFTLETAGRLQVSEVMYLESPHRWTEGQVTLTCTTGIVRCRAELLRAQGKLRHLRRIEFVGAPQAKFHLSRGFTCEPMRCATCREPLLQIEVKRPESAS